MGFSVMAAVDSEMGKDFMRGRKGKNLPTSDSCLLVCC